MSKSIRTFHSVLAATLMFSALSPSTVRAGANLCEVAFSETEKVGTSIVAVAANHDLISTNAKRGSPLTTAERLLELQSALSLEERESIYNYIIAHPQMFFGRMGQAVADTVAMSVAAGPGKNRILSMRAAEILKWAPDKVATHKHLLDLDKRIFGESAFQILSDLSRRSYYDGETLRDLNGDRIIIEGSRVASKTKFLTNENAELFTRFFEWIVQKPERVQFAKLLLAEASPTFAAGMQRQVETPRGPFHKPVDLSAVETQLARSSALWKLKLKRFILIYGEETKVLVAVRKEQIRLARVAGLTPSKH
ncbi:MAG: hypothetical protein EOP05_11685 [Proteobacteria bacterium]|nr:MAG: hypothetical protein EOP05_11685 [Pseudomonadota bacterium]